jgi:uncharacterized protein (DUF2062 family)
MASALPSSIGSGVVGVFSDMFLFPVKVTVAVRLATFLGGGIVRVLVCVVLLAVVRHDGLLFVSLEGLWCWFCVVRSILVT